MSRHRDVVTTTIDHLSADTATGSLQLHSDRSAVRVHPLFGIVVFWSSQCLVDLVGTVECSAM